MYTYICRYSVVENNRNDENFGYLKNKQKYFSSFEEALRFAKEIEEMTLHGYRPTIDIRERV